VDLRPFDIPLAPYSFERELPEGRGGELTRRQRRILPPEGIDPRYSDSYVPVGVEYLAYPVAGTLAGATPYWQRL
jgi:hypothetical protein